MSAVGTKRTCRAGPHMSAFGGKADMAFLHCICLLLARSGHSVCPLSLKSGLFEDQNNQFFLRTFQRLKSASESEKVSAMPSALSRSAGPSGTHMKRGEREAS